MNPVPMPSLFRQVFGSEPLRGEFRQFFQTIFHSLDGDKVFNAVDTILQDSSKSDKTIYTELQSRIHSLQKRPSLLWRIWSLCVLKKGMGKQAQELLLPFRKEIFQNYLEVYDRRYVNTMKNSVGLPLRGERIAVSDRNDVHFSDRIQASALFSRYPYTAHIPLNDPNDPDCTNPLEQPQKTHQPIPDTIRESSIDLVNCLGGFHHIPEERVQPFAQSLQRVLKPGGVLLFRDHDARNADLIAIASLVHTFVNLADGVSWEVEKREIRQFLPMTTWTEKLSSYGFTRVSTAQCILKNDPTANAMAIFVKTPKNLDELKATMAYRKDYQRPKDGTRATWIEWGNVRFSKQYASFLQNHHEYAFDYLGHLGQHWKYFYYYVRESWKDQEISKKDWLLSDNMAMNLFILTSATIQCLAGAILNIPGMLLAKWKHGEKWRSIANLSALERFQAKVELEYSQFIDHTPFYCFPYFSKIQEMWKTIFKEKQDWSTTCLDFCSALTGTLSFTLKGMVSAPIRAFYTSDANKEPDLIHILVKDPNNKVNHPSYHILHQLQDGHKIVAMPRYRPFTQFCQDISATQDVELLQIGGQNTISLDVVYSNDQRFTAEKADRIYTMNLLQDPRQRFFATYQIPVDRVQKFIRETREKGGQIEYVHE